MKGAPVPREHPPLSRLHHSRPAPGPSPRGVPSFLTGLLPRAVLWLPRNVSGLWAGRRCIWARSSEGQGLCIFRVKSVRAPSPSGHEAPQSLSKITMCCPFSDYKSNTYSWSKTWETQKSTKKKIHAYSTTWTHHYWYLRCITSLSFPFVLSLQLCVSVTLSHSNTFLSPTS